MHSKQIIKDPDAVLDYGIDWTLWLDGDTITASSWAVPVGLTEESDSFNDTITVVWLSGGTLNIRYEIVNSIVTAAGREDDRTLTIVIKEK